MSDGKFDDAVFLIVGAVRNCAKTLRPDVERLSRALGSNRARQWLLIESDSDDSTVAVLEQLAGEIEGFRFISMGGLKDRLPLRTERLAHCRNRYLDEVASDPRYADISHVIVADFDGVNCLIDAAGFESCWTRSDWDVVSANPAAPYYDVWALRHPSWSPNNCWAQQRFLFEHGVSWRRSVEDAVHARMICIDPAMPWIEVDSAFGGFAIYRRWAFAAGRYHGLDEDGNELCEHVPFHRSIADAGGRLFINPAMINAGYNEHNLALRLDNRIRSAPRRWAGELRHRLKTRR